MVWVDLSVWSVEMGCLATNNVLEFPYFGQKQCGSTPYIWKFVAKKFGQCFISFVIIVSNKSYPNA